MFRKFAAAAGAALLMSGTAHAAVFSYSTDFAAGPGAEWSISAPFNGATPGILGALGTNVDYESETSATLSQTSSGASGNLGGLLRFDLLLFDTIDGGGSCCTDIFSLKINGTKVYEGGFKYYSDFVSLNTNGATYTTPDFSTRSFVVPFTVQAGANSFEFRYSPLQQKGDESWGLDNVSVVAEVADSQGAVPEPDAWALMIAGFGAAGAALRRKRAALA